MTVGTLIKIIVAIAALAAVAAGAYALVLARKKKAEKALEAAKKDGSIDPSAEVRLAIDKGRAALLKKVPDKGTRTELPTFLFLGEPSSGKTSLLAGSGLSMQLVDGKDPLPGDASAVNVWLLDQAIVVDAAGRLLFQEGGAAAPDAAYKTLLAELKKLDPSRPIDGILLAAPSGELSPNPRSTPAEQKRKSAILRSALTQAQQTLGMNVPIYVVVTQCDKVRGFSRLSKEVPPASRDDILGWSSPYPPFAPEADDWIDEATSTVRDELLRQQSRRFANSPAVNSPDDYFLFPSELIALGKGLHSYLDPIFLDGTAQDHLTVRGLYFCGADMPPAGSALPQQAGMPALPPPLPAAPAEIKTLFFKNLFKFKVFAERNLGKPTELALKRRNRTNLILQIVAACIGGMFVAALWIDSGRVQRRTAALMPTLNEIRSYTPQAKAQVDESVVDFDTRRQIARAVLAKIEPLEAGRLRSVLNPGSWWSRLDSRTDDAFHRAFERYLVDAFRAGLDAQLSAIVQPLPQHGDEPFPPLSLDKSPEFIRFDTWLKQLTSFERAVVRHDSLIGELPSDATPDARAQNVAELSDYLLGYKTSPTIPVEYYRNALARGALRQPFTIQSDQQKLAREKAMILFAELEARVLELYVDQPVRDDVAELVNRLGDLEKKGADYTADDLWKLRDVITRVEDHLATPTLSWVASDSLPPNESAGMLLKNVQLSTLLGRDVEEAMRGQISEKLKGLKEYVTTARTPLSDFILERKNGIPTMKLSPFIVALKAPIDALRQQAFMTAAEPQTVTPELERSRVDWDADILKDAARLPKAYETFVQTGTIKGLDKRIQDTIADLTVRQLQVTTLGGVARAARTATPIPTGGGRQFEIVRSDSANLTQAAGPLKEMIGAFVRLRMEEPRDRLRALLRGQGSTLLSRAGDVLRAENLYGVKKGGFTWWDGETTPAFEAFSVPDAGRLSEYAAAQRTRAATLHKELAESVLATMESPEVGADGSDPGVGLWESVGWPLKDFDNKKAGNGVSTLETFMLSDLPLITGQNCFAELDKRAPPDREGGFFAAQQAHITNQLRERCRMLASDNMRGRYASLRRTFNRELAGKFPFVKVEPGLRVEDARPETVRAFLKAAADFRTDFGYFLRKDSRASASEVDRFLEKIDGVRAFMMPMWAQTDSADDGIYDVKVEFRVNPQMEVGGNRIAEWATRFGEERLFRDGPKVEASWRVSDPVRTDLRWAKSSLDMPLPTQGSNVVVNDRSVTFEERGPWSLLRMIAFHQTSTESNKADGASHVLEYVVQSTPDPSGGFVERVGSDTNTVRVYIRVTITGVEKDKPLRYPEFPTTAPNL
jgi:type VI secretion system protein ImpL